MANLITTRCWICGDLFTYKQFGPPRKRCDKVECKTKKIRRLDNKPPQVVNFRPIEVMHVTGLTHEERLVLRERVGKAKRDKYWRERKIKQL